MINQTIKLIIIVLLIFWFSIFFLRQIDLSTADLGRHIKNGEMVLSGQFDVLKTNFYSYTHPDYEFVNHHWLSGVTFFIIYKLTNFTGLSLFYFLLSLTTFLIFFIVETRHCLVSTKHKNNFWITAILSFALIPLITDRQEIRPEVFTYLLSGVFLYLLIKYRDGLLNKKWLWLLPILIVFWINLHIGFAFGLLLIGVFLIETLIRRQKDNSKILFFILVITCLATLINPFGIQGTLQPLTIFNEYGYDIVENKSIPFLENYGLQDPNYLLIKLFILILIISFVLILLFKRKSFSIAYFILAGVFSGLAYLVVRNSTHFGLITLPILAFNTKEVASDLKTKFDKWYANYIFIILAIIILSFTFIYNYNYLISRIENNFGLGLRSRNNASIEFFKTNKIQGPVFNNYDIGSYLIFHLYPTEKVFVDNRPETYPVEFFKQEYIPMQENNEKWNELDKEYDFNAIFFARHDLTPWAQNFLIERVQDNNWVPVFFDNYTIIFIKRLPSNAEVIERYEIGRDRFNIKNR